MAPSITLTVEQAERRWYAYKLAWQTTGEPYNPKTEQRLARELVDARNREAAAYQAEQYSHRMDEI